MKLSEKKMILKNYMYSFFKNQQLINSTEFIHETLGVIFPNVL